LKKSKRRKKKKEEEEEDGGKNEGEVSRYMETGGGLIITITANHLHGTAFHH